jgi:hypothetical protein
VVQLRYATYLAGQQIVQTLSSCLKCILNEAAKDASVSLGDIALGDNQKPSAATEILSKDAFSF